VFTSLVSFVVTTQKWVVGCIRDNMLRIISIYDPFCYLMCNSAETVLHSMASYIECILE